MQMLIVDKKLLKEIITLNKGSRYRKIIPSLLNDGRRVLNADILGDLKSHNFWKKWENHIKQCPVEEIDISMIEKNIDTIIAASVDIDEKLIKDEEIIKSVVNPAQ